MPVRKRANVKNELSYKAAKRPRLSEPARPYVYEPLDVAKDEIRFCTLLPGSKGSKIAIELTAISLMDYPYQEPVTASQKAHDLLPPGWTLRLTPEGRKFYSSPDPITINTWTHPNPDFTEDQDSSDTTESKRLPFEALSYA